MVHEKGDGEWPGRLVSAAVGAPAAERLPRFLAYTLAMEVILKTASPAPPKPVPSDRKGRCAPLLSGVGLGAQR